MATLLELVVDSLDAQLALRKRELTDLRLLVITTSGQRGQSMCRAAHVAAYAHWEGFTKFAIEAYLQYLCDTRPSVRSLRIQLRALSFIDSIKAAGNEASTFGKAVDLVDAIESSGSQAFAVNAKELTRIGNLVAKNLRVLLNFVGLEYLDYYATKSNLIDSVLCGRRHRIAHGSLEPVEKADAVEAIDLVVGLCETLNTQLQDALIYDRHLTEYPQIPRQSTPPDVNVDFTPSLLSTA